MVALDAARAARLQEAHAADAAYTNAAAAVDGAQGVFTSLRTPLAKINADGGADSYDWQVSANKSYHGVLETSSLDSPGGQPGEFPANCLLIVQLAHSWTDFFTPVSQDNQAFSFSLTIDFDDEDFVHPAPQPTVGSGITVS